MRETSERIQMSEPIYYPFKYPDVYQEEQKTVAQHLADHFEKIVKHQPEEEITDGILFHEDSSTDEFEVFAHFEVKCRNKKFESYSTWFLEDHKMRALQYRKSRDNCLALIVYAFGYITDVERSIYVHRLKDPILYKLKFHEVGYRDDHKYDDGNMFHIPKQECEKIL